MAKEEKKKTTTTKKTVAKNEGKKETTVKATPKKASNTTKTQEPKSTPNKKAQTAIIQEENHYGRTLIAGLLIIIIFVGGFLAIKYKENGGLQPDDKYVATQDEKDFKEEYESLNGTTRANGIKNKEISIMEDNNIKYITVAEAAEILDSGSGIIYFGFAACPWCRNAVPALLNAMDSSSLDTIYYVNVRPDDDTQKDIRDTYILNNKNKAKKSKEAADPAYYDILTALANDLDDYVLTTDTGKKVNTGEKRLSAPTVVAVKEGIVVGFHEGTIEGHEKDENGVLPDLTKDEETELLNIYSQIISKYLNDSCGEDTEGC